MNCEQHRSTSRGQSHVIGVALLLGLTVVVLGTLTASVGVVMQDNAENADATRVAGDVDDALQPVETTGTHTGQVAFSGGELVVTERELRILDENGEAVENEHGETVEPEPVDALVYRAGDQRVTFQAGAIVRDTGHDARMVSEPPVTVSRDPGGVFVVGAPVLNASTGSVATTEPTTVTLHTDVTHERIDLGKGTYRIAVETDAPDAWEAYFESQGAAILDRTTFEGDRHESVVVEFEGDREGYLVVHDMRLEVTVDG